MFEIVKDEFRKHKGVSIILPKRATKSACAYDIYAPCNITIPAGDARLIWTDIKVGIPDGYVCLLNVRSSMGKHRIMLANTQGWVDADYYENEDNDGNIGLNLFNFGKKPFEIKAGDRIAQAMITKFYTFEDNVDTVRTGGFGSTGI